MEAYISRSVVYFIQRFPVFRHLYIYNNRNRNIFKLFYALSMNGIVLFHSGYLSRFCLLGGH